MSALFDLSGQVAVVTGGGKGIGRELAHGLARVGIDVVVASRTLADVEAVAVEVPELGRRALAVEWAPHNVTSYAIAPTTTLTGETAHQYAVPVAYVAKARDSPSRRLGTPTDLVGAVVYLVGPAADFVTGHVLVVDGGYTVRRSTGVSDPTGREYPSGEGNERRRTTC